MGILRRAWLRLHEPRVVTAIQTVIYLVAFAIGVSILIAPPLPAVLEWGGPLPMIWAAWFMVGGGMGAAGCLSGHWWAERVGLVACTVAVFMYLSLILFQRAPQHASHVVQVLLISWALLQIGQRWARIRKAPLDPSRGTHAVDSQ